MKVTFREEGHVYTHRSLGQFTSVTTIVSHYKNPFDEAYWSDYKAIKDEMEERKQWYAYKSMVGGWENVVHYWRKNPVYLDDILDRKNTYLRLWKQKREKACEYGTAIHRNKEDRINYKKKEIYHDGVFTVSSPSRIMEYPDFNLVSVYTEALVYNETYRVAGQVDKINQMKRIINIRDYKTNESISTEGFRNQMMTGPLKELPDCDLSAYTMQMSTYGWLLEQVGYKVNKLEIEHTRAGKIIPVPYRYDLVPKMLYDYARNVQRRGLS